MSELFLAPLICGQCSRSFLPTSARVSSPSTESAASVLPGDLRLQQLDDWLAGLFGDRDYHITVASADASFRRYFRVLRRGETLIAMDAPPDKEDMEPYV